jgi:hypothetical protein
VRIDLGSLRFSVLCAAAATATTACGRLNFGIDEQSNIGVDASDNTDAKLARCDVRKPFGAANTMPFAALNSAQFDMGVEQTDDSLTGFFWSNRTAGEHIYQVTRGDIDSSFALPVDLNLNTFVSEDVRDPAPSGDGLRLVFAAGVGGIYDLYEAKRGSLMGSFSTRSPIAALNLGSQSWGPFLSSDALTLYYVEGADLATSVRADRSLDFQAPSKLASLNSTDQDFEPVVSKDELTIYFGSDRPGGRGLFDIWQASRGAKQDEFGPPAPVVELNTDFTEFPSRISPDGCEMFMTRDVPGQSWQMMVATRPL